MFKKKNKMKLFQVSADESSVYNISLVESPAIETDFVFLSNDSSKQFFFEDNYKHIVYGPVLIPNKPIYRNNGTDEFYIQFSKDSVEKLAYEFLMNDYNHNFTEHHEYDVDDVSVIESWIKSSENDKSVDLNIDVPVGTWIIGAKINNTELWNDIKTKKVKGFSVESFLNLEEILMEKNNTTNNMTKKEKFEQIEVNESFWSRITKIIRDAIALAPATKEETDSVVENAVEEIKKDEAVTENPQEEKTTEEVVVEDPVKTDDSPEAIAQDVVEEVVENTETQDEAKNDLQLVIDELNLRIEEMENKIKALQGENDNLKIQNEKLSKTPSVNPINTKAEKLSSQDRFSKMLAIVNGDI